MTNSDAPKLPGLSSSDTRWLLKEAEQLVRERGFAPVLDDGLFFRLPDGRTLGLHNLALAVRRLPRRKWRRYVRDHLATILSVDPAAPITRDQIFAKLWAEEDACEFAAYEPLMPLPGVAALLVAKAQGATQEFGSLDQLGDRDEAYAAALENLGALPRPRHVRRLVDPHGPNSWVEFLSGTGPFGAARVLVLPELLRQVLRRDFPSSGVLVSVPNKFELWVHEPVDESVVPTAVAMAWHSYADWGQSPYAISPNVFLVSPDMRAQVLVAPDRDGVEIHTAAMDELWQRLPGPRDARDSA